MTDPGLSNRLRQHSRRSGLVVGLSMAGAIAILVGVFVAIYAISLPFVSDFVPLQAAERTPTPPPAIIAQAETIQGVAPAPTSVLNAITPRQNQAAVAPEATRPAEATETAEAFEPTHQIKNETGESIYLRRTASIAEAPIRSLAPETPLLYLGEETETPDNGTWMRFRTAENEEGWVREVDAEPFQE